MNYIYLVSVIVWLGLNPVTSWAQADTLTTVDPSLLSPPPVVVLPSPTGAMLRSAALPGWGQFYNKKPLKGSLFIILQAGLFTGVMMERDQTGAGGLTALGNTLLLALIGTRIYSMADAYVDAHFADFDNPRARISPLQVRFGLRVKW